MGASQKKYHIVDKLEKDVKALQDMNSDLRRSLDAERTDHNRTYNRCLKVQSALDTYTNVNISGVTAVLKRLQAGAISFNYATELVSLWARGGHVETENLPLINSISFTLPPGISIQDKATVLSEQKDRLTQTLEEIISLRDEANQALNVLRQAREAKVPFYGEVEGAFISCRDKLHEAYDKAKIVVEDVKNGH